MTGRQPLDLDAIAGFLASCGVEVSGDLRAEVIHGGRSNLTYLLADDVRRWVLRRPPLAGATPSAHDVGREFRVARALEHSPVPVAPAVAHCEDTGVIGAEFTVVGFVDGLTVQRQDQLDAFSDAQLDAAVDALVAVLADLHAVDAASVGLDDLGRPTGYAARQLQRWSRQWGLVSAERSADAERLAARIGDRLPSQERTTLVHGDYRIDNTIVAPDDPAEIRAVVDWELSTLGDPVADVALMCAYRHPGLDLVLGTRAAWTSDRLPDAGAIAARYEAVSTVPLRSWDVHLGLAYYKLGVIAAGIQHRYQQGATSDTGFARAGESVGAFFAAGLAHLAHA